MTTKSNFIPLNYRWIIVISFKVSLYQWEMDMMHQVEKLIDFQVFSLSKRTPNFNAPHRIINNYTWGSGMVDCWVRVGVVCLVGPGGGGGLDRGHNPCFAPCGWAFGSWECPNAVDLSSPLCVLCDMICGWEWSWSVVPSCQNDPSCLDQSSRLFRELHLHGWKSLWLDKTNRRIKSLMDSLGIVTKHCLFASVILVLTNSTMRLRERAREWQRDREIEMWYLVVKVDFYYIHAMIMLVKRITFFSVFIVIFFKKLKTLHNN